MNKHTPGPWVIFCSNLCVGNETTSVATNGCSKGDKHHTGCAQPGGEREANAHLIAAAPEMFEALKDLANEYGKIDFHENVYRKAIWAIAKAEGRI
tara:strand:+ start:184 stop:471 length:288 start_codon:yes stop_codon:yes gene_type:complete